MSQTLAPVAEITKALKIISSGLCVNQNTVLLGDSEFWLPEGSSLDRVYWGHFG